MLACPQQAQVPSPVGLFFFKGLGEPSVLAAMRLRPFLVCGTSWRLTPLPGQEGLPWVLGHLPATCSSVNGEEEPVCPALGRLLDMRGRAPTAERCSAGPAHGSHYPPPQGSPHRVWVMSGALGPTATLRKHGLTGSPPLAVLLWKSRCAGREGGLEDEAPRERSVSVAFTWFSACSRRQSCGFSEG